MKKPHIEQKESIIDLLCKVKGHSGIELPKTITRDVYTGLLYALSTMPEKEQKVIRIRYLQNAPYEDICMEMAIPREEVLKIEEKALIALRASCRWNYIQYGVAGYTKKRNLEEYNKGFHAGFLAGYKKGMLVNGDDLQGSEPPIYDLPLEDLQLSVRAFNSLYAIGCRSIGDVATIEKSRIMCIRNLGKKAANEVALALQRKEITPTDWELFLL